ncbi:MAG TPA: PadR family transcriptional regulator [Bacteroidota bacterium]|nr:PadR family transcriptional regulator [Bacteroidota bacterium]
MLKTFLLGFIKIHILHHALKSPVYGLWLIEELRGHGYTMSPGTLYPILHSLEEEGLLKSREVLVEGKIRRNYVTTPKGRRALGEAKKKIGELVNEIME